MSRHTPIVKPVMIVPSEPEEPLTVSPTGSAFHQFPPKAMPMWVQSHPVVKRVAQILQNGTRQHRNPHSIFPAHTHLLIQLENVYNRRVELNSEDAQDQFLAALQAYLEAASIHVRQAAKPEQIPGMIAEIHALLQDPETGGLYQIGRYLLAVARAPMDSF